MQLAIIIIQGLIGLLGLGAFLVGFFTDYYWVMLFGGCLLVLDDIMDIASGALNPIFPILLAIALAFIISPWYTGVFWASAIFSIFDIPANIAKVIFPRRTN